MSRSFTLQAFATRLFAVIAATVVAYSAMAQTQNTSTSKADAAATTATQTTSAQRLKTDFDRFISWFGGEWNNNEQVWQQLQDTSDKLDKPSGKPVEDKITHTHHIFAPVTAPKIGAHTFYIQQSLDGDLSKAYRQRLYRLTQDEKANAIKLEIFNFNDEKSFFDAHKRPEQFTSLELSQLRATPGCEVFWRYDETTKSYAGTMPPKACSFVSKRYGDKRIYVTDTLKLTENEIWINDQARDEEGNYVFGDKTDMPIKNRKVRYFTGWAYIHRDGPKADISDKKFSYQRNISIHNEGQRIPVMYDDGTPSPYMIELAQLTYQNTRTAILKLALINAETKKSVTYIWANTDATRIGMNLSWFQVGLTQKTSRVAYGFGDPLPVVGNAVNK